MRTSLTCILMVVFLTGLLPACGGSSPGTSSVEDTPMGITVEPEHTAGLPALDSLPAAAHHLSMAGPGWYDIPVSTALATSGEVLPHAENELPLEAAAKPAFACYGVHGFDGDNGPTSARITVSGITGEYYVAFSNYQDCRWVFSGPYTDSATAEINLEPGLLLPSTCIADNGCCYLAVILPEGGSMALTGIELGVHGGAIGPGPAMIYGSSGAAMGIQLFWNPSPDSQDPDFAGYILERAPLTHGDFAPLTLTPIHAQYYIDNTVELSMVYRYRLMAVDASGNRSIPTTVNQAADAADLLYPVPLIDLPHSPVYGPLEVVFDMSASYDPQGDPIDDYSVRYGSVASTLSGPDPIMSTILQPGCYQLQIQVTSGTRTTSYYVPFKVYPQWEAAPVIVNNSTPGAYRGLLVRSGREPTAGNLVHCYVETESDHAVFMMEQPGGELKYETYGLTDDFECIQEPVATNDCLYFLLSSDLYSYVFSHDGSPVRLCASFAKGNESAPGLAADDTGVAWLAYNPTVGMDMHLSLRCVNAAFPRIDVVENTGDLNWIEACYNPDACAMDFIYTAETTNLMYWARYNMDGVPVTGTEIHPGTPALVPDLEVNPLTGRPALLYYSTGNRYFYTDLNADNSTWSMPEIVDNSTGNTLPADLVMTEAGPYAMFGLADGTNNLYHVDAGWIKLNSLPDANTFLNFHSMVTDLGTGNMVATYRTTGFELASYLLEPGGPNTVRWIEPGIEPQGHDLRATAGTDGLHVVALNSSGDMLHCISPDGAVWNIDAGIPSASNLELATCETGDVYLSYQSGTNAILDWWNGAAWQLVHTYPAAAGYRSLLCRNNWTEGVLWSGYIEATGMQIHVTAVHGQPPTIDTFPIAEPVWLGSVSPASRKMVLLAGGPEPTYGFIASKDWGNDMLSELLIPSGHYMACDNPYMQGKSIDHAWYLDSSACLITDVFWLSHRNFAIIGRCELTTSMPWNTTDIQYCNEWPTREPRRSVTAATTASQTAVGLIAGYNGDYRRLEWSNWGEWEELPLPDCIEHMQAPELVVDMEGRWHIIYRNWVTDDLMCISTL